MDYIAPYRYNKNMIDRIEDHTQEMLRRMRAGLNTQLDRIDTTLAKVRIHGAHIAGHTQAAALSLANPPYQLP
jgi:hypothetical protein